MPDKNYYKILGVNKSAGSDEIKKAYRKLAMKFHPDKNKGNKAAEDRFKEISEAYAVLSDPEKKKQYDNFGAEGFQQRYSQEDIFKNFDFSDILKEFGFGNVGGRKKGGGPGVFTNIFTGGGAGPRQRTSPHSTFSGMGRGGALKGQDAIYELPVRLEDIFKTTEKTISLNLGGESKHIKVKIPAGITDGKKLGLADKGMQSPGGGPPGDLYIKIKVLAHPVFRLEGDDLYVGQKIKYSEAVLGTKVEVSAIDGTKLSLKIPPGTQDGAKMRLKNYGMPKMGSKAKGNEYVIISIAVPKKLNKKQRAMVEKLSDLDL